MRITMICIGSTGDVRPYLVLGRELRRRGHEVSICAFANFASAVKAEGLGFKPVSGDVKTFMANLMNGANGVAFLKQVRDTLREFIEPFLADLEAATEDAQAIVGTYFGQVFQSLAEMRHVPYVQTQYFPSTPTRRRPSRRRRASGWARRGTWRPTSWATCSSARLRNTTSPTGGSRAA